MGISDKLKEIIAKGVSPADAGYETVDLQSHFPDDQIGTPSRPAPDAEKVAKMKRKRRMNLRKLYNSFETKDMSFEAFCKEFESLNNPTMLRRDLACIKGQRDAGKRNKAILDRAIRMN
jgi:hypothetical protein